MFDCYRALFWPIMGASLILCSAQTTNQPVPLPPSQDPFYTSPKGFESAAPGTVLRVRAAPGNLTTLMVNSSGAYNILYRTTDSQYKPSWAVTTLFIPSTSPQGNDTGVKALLSYQIPYDSADMDASPSFSLYAPVTPLSSIVNNDISSALSHGWYVNVPDYEGPLASFTAGVQAGHATLDSIRAVLSPRFGLSPTARYALWGYSGGALASEWAAELQVQYAPELDFAGAALGGLVTNITDGLEKTSGTRWAGLAPSGLVGLTSQYDAAYNYLLAQLNPSGPFNKTTFLSVRNMSIVEAWVAFNDQNIFDYFKNGPAFL